MNQINIRTYKKSDAKMIQDIIRETWKYDLFCSAKISKKLAKVYLYSCLSNQTYIRVATIHDMPIGIIMGKDINHYKSISLYKIKQFFSIISLNMSTEGRNISKIFSKVSNIDKHLLSKSNKKYDGEVAFFAINKNYLGFGIGRKLFNELIIYMKKQKISYCFLYTDTSCNYQFYEHVGMKMVAEKLLDFNVKNYKNHMIFFLLDIELEE